MTELDLRTTDLELDAVATALSQFYIEHPEFKQHKYIESFLDKIEEVEYKNRDAIRL